MEQPDGRGAGTPGGEAATEALIADLDRRGLAAPATGRTQAFPMAARHTSGVGTLTWGDRRRVAGDGWEAVPGSYALTARVAFPPLSPLGNADISVGSPIPVWRIDGGALVEAVAGQVVIDPALGVLLAGQEGVLALEPAIVTGRNVMAWVPGRGALAGEVVIVGAHRDHVAPIGDHVFPGADDNASGVAATVCALATFAEADPAGDRRAVLGVWFDGEEDGMWGSAAYVADPVVPLDDTAAVVVLDMVGRRHGGKVTLGGTGAKGWARLLAFEASAAGVELAPDPEPSHSDDVTFDGVGVPAVHVYTGKHADYHQPTDTRDRLDLRGIAAISDLTARALVRLARAPEALPAGTLTDVGIRLGGVDGRGRPVVGAVVPYSPAALDGWQPGDVVAFRGDRWSRVEPCAWHYVWDRIDRVPVPEP